MERRTRFKQNVRPSIILAHNGTHEPFIWVLQVTAQLIMAMLYCLLTTLGLLEESLLQVKLEYSIAQLYRVLHHPFNFSLHILGRKPQRR